MALFQGLLQRLRFGYVKCLEVAVADIAEPLDVESGLAGPFGRSIGRLSRWANTADENMTTTAAAAQSTFRTLAGLR
jgi:hypothetical protein